LVVGVTFAIALTIPESAGQLAVGRQSGSWPATALEEISGDVLQRDFWTISHPSARNRSGQRGCALSQLEAAKDRFLLFLHHDQKGRL